MLKDFFRDRVVVPYLFFWARFLIRLRRPVIVGITGSVGKTTTKEMIASVLVQGDAQPLVGLVGTSPKNMNDNLGLPQAVLGYHNFKKPGALLASMCLMPFRVLALATFARYPKVLVLEYGTHWQGHIHKLAKVAPPTVAVVTAIGPAHLERLKTVKGVAEEKSGLIRVVPTSGLVILGTENEYLSQMAGETRAPVVEVSGRGLELARNIAREVARYFGLPEETITRGLDKFEPLERRLNVLKLGPVTTIDDTFNANPLSMKLALDTLAGMAKPGQRRVAVLGVMGELGPEAHRYHGAIGTYARERAEVVIGVGDLARCYQPDLWFADSGDCADHLEDIVLPGDYLLVKGSASVKMYKVVEKLKEIAGRYNEDAASRTARTKTA